MIKFNGMHTFFSPGKINWLWAIASAVLVVTGCSKEGGSEKKAPIQIVSAEDTVKNTGDLAELKERGKFRILVQRSPESYLPREGAPMERDRELAVDFAHTLELKPIVVYLDDFKDLIPALIKGEGDLIAANLTITAEREKQVAFTLPIDYSREQIVGRKSEKKINDISALHGRSIGVQEGTSFLDTVSELQEKYPDIKLNILEGRLTDDEIMDLVAAESVDLAVMDSNVLDVALTYRSDIKSLLDISGERSIAWAVRQNNHELLKAVNNFLELEELSRRRDKIYRDDLAGIKKRKTLRMLTTNNATNYFLFRGRLLGFEYELVKHFADQLKLRLEVVVVPAYDQLIPWLLEGRGDLVAAFMTISPAREAQGIKFSRPYHYAEEILVARTDDRRLKSYQDLEDRTVVVRPGSSYRASLEKIKAKGVDLIIGNAPETMTTEEIIDRVASGEYDLTVADTQILAIEESYRDDITGMFEISKKVAQGWAVRKDNPDLLSAINDFLKKEYRGLFYNVTYKKYFNNPKNIRDNIKEYSEGIKGGKISPYDEIIKDYSNQYGFIWRLIAAQIYQESRFNPKAESWVGAKGLMQMMPKTAEEFGFTRLEDPKVGIHAGIKYLDWIRDRFGDKPDILNRIWFSLAAYNAGIGHLSDARKLAGRKGWNPLVWFENVEKAMILLSQPEYSRKARYGYVRGSEPVKYVQSIADRFHAYQTLAVNSAEQEGKLRIQNIKGSAEDKAKGGKIAPSEASEYKTADVTSPQTFGPAKSKRELGKNRYTGYTVQPGDTLSRIARKVYGKSVLWKTIYDANREQLKSPHNIKVGQVLKIPVLELP